MEISKLKPLTYGMIINKVPDKRDTISLLNLQQLIKNFKLDNSFISKSYYQTNPELAYSDPPKGPIPAGFECLFCNQVGPRNHLQSCTRPFEDLLVLSESGKELFPNFEIGTSYNDIVLKRGQKKIISSSIKSGRFTDNVNLIYRNINDQQCIIRISKNGSINIISASFGNDTLASIIINKINNSQGAVINPPFIINNTTKYVITGQFNLYPDVLRDIYHVNLDNLDTILNEYMLKFESRNAFMKNKIIYFIDNYIYNSGDIKSRGGKFTNPYIQLVLIPRNKDIKINVMIYKRGAVQLKASYSNTDHKEPLELSILVNIYNFLKDLLLEMTTEIDILSPDAEVVKRGILNTVDGKQPRVCQNRPGLMIRPEPYSFYGKCPMPGYYIRPEGMLRPDGKYEPCCYRLKNNKKDSKKRYESILTNGYPDIEAGTYNESTETPDLNSAVFTPGSNKIESRHFKGLLNMSRKNLMECLTDFGYLTV
jgi:hypothetical protein